MNRSYFSVFLIWLLLVAGARPVQGQDSLAEGWNQPPQSARLRAYWWWLNGHVTPEAITKDLEWMQRIGMGGGLVFDAGGATQGGHDAVPPGPLFGSPEWRQLFLHALREADRLNLEIGLNLTSGWNLGGPMVTPDKAAKVIAWSEIQVQGPGPVSVALPQPAVKQSFYRDTVVLAYRVKAPAIRRKPIRKLAEKSAYHELGGSATDCSPLLLDEPATPGEEDVQPQDVLDLTNHRDAAGNLSWDAPEGSWVVLRFGYTNNGAKVSTASGTWGGLVLDYLDADALRWYWGKVVDPIIVDAGPLCGKAWKMVQTDSWELGGVNWTEKFPAEFQKRRGYDLRPWLPVIAGRIVGSRDASNRFLNDFRRTLADCIAENHYGTMAALAREHGLGIQPESAGPHTASLDGLQCYGRSEWPMSEFWVPSPHRPADTQRFFVKQAASAAHIYGKPVVCAEGFTSIGPQWNDILWSSQKPSFDHEACAGLNLVFWHAFTCSPKEMGLPGQEYFAGTHFNPQITWAQQAPAFVGYLNRCQFLLQQGKFVGDVLYYYGNHVPNIARLKSDDPARILPEYDYDVVNEEVLLQAGVQAGRIILPGGMSYRVLALPDVKVLSLAVARKLRDLVQAGAVVVGPKPETPTGHEDDAELKSLAAALWDGGKISTGTARAALNRLGVSPDVSGWDHWIHRKTGDAEIYFLSNQKAQSLAADITFRVSGKLPELWDAVTGDHHAATLFTQKDGLTTVPLALAPDGSQFVIFRRPIEANAANGAVGNVPKWIPVQELTGPWEVCFGETRRTFDTLTDWSQSSEASLRYYSGTATYRKTFAAPVGPGRYDLDLGNLSMLAEVRLNGKNLGVVWCPPWRVEITQALKPAGNQLEVDVVNGWWNQLVGDPKKTRTHTNIKLKADARPQESGLLGPVRIMKSATP